MRLLTLAALLTVTATLQACTHEQKASSESIFAALGASPLPGAIEDDLGTAEAVVEEPVIVAPPSVEEPPPAPTYAYPYTGPDTCPGSIFRVLTCDTDGSWHWLDSNMAWMD